jgi:spermidine/putrescine transport system permease protein
MLWLARPKMRMLLQMLVMLPFLTNFIIRTEATRIFLSVDGPMSHLLMAIHQTAVPVTFLNTQGAVWFGMVTNYLPMMVFPLFVALDSLDYDLIQAAYELGANKIQAFFYVLLPLIRGGIMTGFTLVFVPSLGEFIIPQILGGGRLMLLGGLITEQFLKYRNWPFGAALSALLAIIALVGIYLLGRVVDLQGEGKMG